MYRANTQPPNIFLCGRVFTGKSRIARTLETHYGYESIYVAKLILDSLSEETGATGPFSNEQVLAMKQKLVHSRGPLYMLDEDCDPAVPLVVDSVRSLEVAEALTGKGFSAVLIGASLGDRYSWASQGRCNDPRKPDLSQGDISFKDNEQMAGLDEIAALTDRYFVNSSHTTTPDLVSNILDVLAKRIFN